MLGARALVPALSDGAAEPLNDVSVVQLALAEAQYDLAAELLRFVVPPTDNDNLFASINGAHAAGQQAGAAKSASPAPPRVRRSYRPSRLRS